MHSDKPAVEIRKLMLAYGSIYVVTDFSLSVCHGAIHALAGENGAGKSTVLKAISGLLRQKSGQIAIAGSAGASVPRIGFVLQHDVLPTNMTVASCIQCSASAAHQRLDQSTTNQLLSRVGLSVPSSLRVSALTMHQRQLLQLACALAAKPSVLLLDEPTAVMSQPDSIHFWELINKEVTHGLTVIIATHKLEDIGKYCSHVTVMRSGCHVFTCTTAEVTMADIIDGMAPQGIGDSHVTTTESKFVGAHPIVNISKAESTLMLYPHEIHGIAGLDGSGYEHWLKAVALTKQEGIQVTVKGVNIDKMSVAQRRAHGIGYIPSDRHADAIIGTDSLESNLIYGAVPASIAQLVIPINFRSQHISAELIVNKYDVRPPNVGAAIDTFSGGNQQKFIVGRELERRHQVLVLNQPTRGLDRNASAGLSRKIQTASRIENTAFIVYSDDLTFLLSTCDTISTFSNGCLTQTRPVSEWSETMLVEAIV